MRCLLLVILILSGCNSGSSNSRSYVITQSHETAADTEVTAEQPTD